MKTEKAGKILAQLRHISDTAAEAKRLNFGDPNTGLLFALLDGLAVELGHIVVDLCEE